MTASITGPAAGCRQTFGVCRAPMALVPSTAGPSAERAGAAPRTGYHADSLIFGHRPAATTALPGVFREFSWSGSVRLAMQKFTEQQP